MAKHRNRDEQTVETLVEPGEFEHIEQVEESTDNSGQVVLQTEGNLALKPEEAPAPQADIKYDPERLKELSTTSARVRYLHGQGLKTAEIAKILQKRYQHVRNVLVVPLKSSTQ